MRRFFACSVLFALLAASAISSPRALAQSEPSLSGDLHWRLIGPFRGGRAIAVAGVPSEPDTFYFGAVGGGVWKSENAGRTWTPIFDNEPVASIGAIAVAPSDPNVIYVGSGEADPRTDILEGNGMYKSTDAGKTWTHIGLDDTQQIGSVIIDPKNPDIVYVAALGHPYGPNAQRGVFKSIDGGAHWSKVLYKNVNTGAVDLAMDPTNSNVIFAAMWQTRRPPWSVYPPSNGPGGGLYETTDGGKSWAQITGHGFPGGVVGRIGIAVSPANHDRIYALVDTNNAKTGGVYRSDDAGKTWTYTDGELRIWTRGWYFGGITADPKNADEVYVNNTSTYRSMDGGKTFIPINGEPGGDDNHILWINPTDSSRMILGTDQGVIVSVDDAKTWSSWYNQPTGQFYHAVTDNRFPYWVYGAQQDSGAMAVPSRTIHTGISFREWDPMDVVGESGSAAPDPLHQGLIYGTSSNNGAARELLSTGWEQSIDPTFAHPDTLFRSTWTMPMTFSPADPHELYESHQQVFRSTDGGLSWTIISPDLTRKHLTIPPNLDPATIADNGGFKRRGVVYALAPSPRDKNLLWAGTDDGLVWLTRDNGAHWTNVTPKQLTPWSKVGIIDASRFDSNTAYIAVDRHRLDDNHPYIYKTTDGGAHWQLITNGLPGNEWVNVVREDPVRRGLLYAGTESTVWYSLDDGARWNSLKLNLPDASVRDITFRDGDVIIATHGRAFWILDDASPLRQLEAASALGAAHLFKPRQAVIFQTAPDFANGLRDEGTPLQPETPQGENPPYGAMLNYYLARDTGPVVLSISDAHGRVVRRYSSAEKPRPIDYKRLDVPAHWVHPEPILPADAGMHRWVWDLHDGDAQGALVPPGTYTLTLSAAGHLYRQPLTLREDPRNHATEAALRAQYALALAIQRESQSVSGARAKALKAGQRALADGGAALYAGTPDEGNTVPQDTSSLFYVGSMLDALYGAVESAPAAPTTTELQAWSILRAKADAAMKRVR